MSLCMSSWFDVLLHEDAYCCRLLLAYAGSGNGNQEAIPNSKFLIGTLESLSGPFISTCMIFCQLQKEQKNKTKNNTSVKFTSRLILESCSGIFFLLVVFWFREDKTGASTPKSSTLFGCCFRVCLCADRWCECNSVCMWDKFTGIYLRGQELSV